MKGANFEVGFHSERKDIITKLLYTAGWQGTLHNF